MRKEVRRPVKKNEKVFSCVDRRVSKKLGSEYRAEGGEIERCREGEGRHGEDGEQRNGS
jgi:hypothetical protein